METAMNQTLTILGLESSCDDTAAAVVRHTAGNRPEILASVVHGQSELHRDFGGVVPEIAARAHAEKLDLCVEEALDHAALDLGVVLHLLCTTSAAASLSPPLSTS